MYKWSWKKFLISLVIFFQFGGLIPWGLLSVSAEELRSSETSENNRQSNEENVVKKEDLSKDVQNKLDNAQTSDNTSSDESTELVTKNEINKDILEKFKESDPSTLEEIKENELKSGKEEVIEDRTDYSKTFVHPETGEGETIVFTRPIHDKDEQGNWQEKASEFVENPNSVDSNGEVPVTVPKNITNDQNIQISNEKKAVTIGLPKESYEVSTVKDDRILLASDKDTEPVEVAIMDDSVELMQYVDETSDLDNIKYQLNLPDGKTAKEEKDKGIIGVYENNELTEVIPMPTLLNLDNDMISPLAYSFDEKAATIKVENIKKEQIATVRQAKVALRVMPITSVTVSGVESTSIRQYDDKMSYAFQPYMMIGYDNGYSSGDDGAGHFQTYGVLKIPNEKFREISRQHEIMSATLKMKRIGNAGFWGDTAKDGSGNIVTRTFEAAGLTKDVGNLSSLTYDKFIRQLGSPYGPPAYDDGKETKIGGINTNDRWVDFDITNLANDWKNGAPNYGVLVKNNKMSAHEMPYSQAELFGGKGWTGGEPYVVLEHREKPPIDKNMSLDQTTLKLRPFVRSDNDGLVQFAALGLDGIGRPEATITYRLKDKNDDNKIIYTGNEPSIGRDYLFPNYPVLFEDAQKYLELSSNWQTKELLTTVLKENHLYQSEATVAYNKYNKNEKVEKSYDTFQLYKVSSQDTLSRLLAFYGLEKNRSSFMRDNNMKDEMLTQGNVVFIRNPKKNAGKAYTPKPLTDAEKIRLDSLSMGRGKHCQFNFEPINIGSGNLLYDMTDSTWFDNEEESSFTRTYNAMGNGQDGPIGKNWTLNQMLSLNQLADKSMMFMLEDGGKVFFKRTQTGSYEVEDTQPYKLEKVMETVDDVDKRTFTLTDTQKKWTYTFDATGQIRSIQTSNGSKKSYKYDEETGFLTEISLFNEKKLQFKWDDNAHLTAVTFPDGSKTQYSYNESGDLVKVIDAAEKKFTYTYDDKHRMLSYAGDDGKAIFVNEYDEKNRVTKQTDAVGNEVKLSYEKDSTTTIDANGNKTKTFYNDHYQPTKIEYADGSSETNKYNKFYQLTSATNRDGKTTTYTYDDKGNRTSVGYPDGTKETTTYNEWNQPLIETDRQGGVTQHTYDTNGNEIQTIDPEGNATSYEYDDSGKMLKETNALGQVTAYAYENGNLVSQSDKSGIVRMYTYDDRGLLLTETDGNGKTKTYERNIRGELIKESNFNGNYRTFTYDSEGNQTSKTDFNGNKTSYKHNAIGQVISETNALGGTKKYTYDGNGNISSESDYLGNTNKMKYNSLNQRTEIEFPDGTKAQYFYDKLGNVTKEVTPNGSTTTYTYDINNYLLTEKDGIGNVTTYERTVTGLPVKISFADKSTEEYTYDSVGNLVTKKDKNGKITHYTYNQENQPIIIKNGERETKQAFDMRNNRTEQTNALGQKTSISYDEGGFARESVAADGSKTHYETDGEGNVTKITEPNGKVYTFAYDKNGNKIKDVAPDGTQTLYTYNALNLLETQVKADGSIEQYTYNENGSLISKIDPKGNQTTYSYTKTNELKQVIDALGNQMNYAYDNGGNVIKYTDTIGRVTNYEYNKANQLIKETSPTGVVTSYTYDQMGNISKALDTTKQEETYTYNQSGQLVSVTDSEKRKEQYEYNLYGEMIAEIDIAGNKTSYEYDAIGQVTKTVSPQGMTETNTYDLRNQLIEVQKMNGGKISYQYDEVGNLLKEVKNDTETNTYQYNANQQLIELTDPNGGQTQFSYDSLGRIIETKDAQGATSKQQYDANGNITKEIDAQGNETSYNYDALDRLSTTIDAKGFKQTITYDKASRKISETDFKGNKTTYTYDVADNVIETIDPLNRKTTYTYDLRNQLTKITDPAKASTSYTYNADGTIASETNAKGYEKHYSYDKFSQLTKISDEIHEAPLVAYEYDKFGQLTREVRSGTQETNYAYDKTGRLTKLTYPNQTSICYDYDLQDRVQGITDIRGNKTAFVYDGLGNLKEMLAPNDARTAYEYDKNGNLIKETDPLEFATTFAYNKNNQLTQTTDATGATTKQTVDQRNQVSSITDALGNKQTFDYDGNGNQVKVTDANENSQTFTYDKADRLISTTNRLQKVTTYAYDEQDNLTTITDANNGQTKFTYSSVGELESFIRANGKKETFSYRLDGKLSENTKADGEHIAYQYDELNRTIGKQMKNESFVYDYDENDQLKKADLSTTYDYSGVEDQAIKEQLPTGYTLTFEHNKFGDITKATTNNGEEVKYAYDAFGRQTEIHYPNGSMTSYEYDKKNQMTKVKDSSGETNYSYDGLGQITEILHADGTISQYHYLETGEITEAVSKDAEGLELSSQKYSYDKNRNLETETLRYPKFSIEKDYEYDAENQLVKVTEKERKTTRVTYYVYDNVGNRIGVRQEVNGKSTSAQEWKNNADNQLEEITGEAGANYEYDANGHVSKKQSASGEVTTYFYNPEGQLIQESSTWGKEIFYYYDALGNRVSKAVEMEKNRKLKTDLIKWMKGTDKEAQLRLSNSSITLSDALASETSLKCTTSKNRPWRIDHTGTRREAKEEKMKKALDKEHTITLIQSVNDYTQEYVSPLQISTTSYDKRIKKTEQSTQYYDQRGVTIGDDLDNYHQDGLGSVSAQTNKTSGALSSNNLYQVFGRSERPLSNQAGYRSQYHDDWEQQHLRAREYDTTTGRFIQQDTVFGDVTKPITQNKYIYGNNNPSMYRDDAGRWAWASKAFNAAKNVAKKAVKVVKRAVNTVVKVVKKAVNTVVRTVKRVFNAGASAVNRGVRTVQQTYNQAKQYASQGVRYVSNQVSYYGGQAAQWVGTKAQQAQILYQQAREQTIQLAQQTRKKAEARIRKMCEGASTVWNGARNMYNETKQAVGDFVKKHEGAIKIGLSVASLALTLFPPTAAIGIGIGIGLGALGGASAVTGKDWLTGRELSGGERIIEGAGALLTFLPIASTALKGTTQVGKGMYNTVKQGMQSMNGGNLAFAGGSMSSGVGAVVTRASTEVVSQTGALSSAVAQVGTQISMAAARGNRKETEKASGSDFSKPKHYLDDALKQQGLDKVPEKLKQKWTHGDYNYEVRVHPGDPKYTDAETIYRVSRKAKPVPGKQGSGMEYMDKNGKWWHQSELREFNGDGTLNPLFNHDAAKNTHIPTD